MTQILKERVDVVRHFNRFLTRQMGVLREGLLHSQYSLTEARILFELAHAKRLTAANLQTQLGLDGGYLSRMLNKFEQQGLIARTRSDTDKRQRLISLTSLGQDEFSVLNQRSSEEVSEMLRGLGEGEQQDLVNAMQTIEGILDRKLKYAEPFVLRQHQAGDMGWVIRKHGLIYQAEYGWDESFEALVAQICVDFLNHYEPQRERCWLAEMQGELVGSIFCVKHSEDAAQLRLLIVDSKARGLGLGTRLVEECIRFAKQAGYQKLVLWTNDILVEARHLYEKQGFELENEEKHHSFGKDLIGQNWSLRL